MPICRAPMSTMISRSTVSNCHGPRYGARPHVLVNTVVDENPTTGIL